MSPAPPSAALEVAGDARRVWQALTVSFGLAVICLLSDLSSKVAAGHQEAYHFDGPPSVLFVPVLLDVAMIAIALAGVLLAAPRGRPRAMVWAAILLSLPWVALNQWYSITQVRMPHLLNLSLATGVMVGVAAVGLAWRSAFEERLQQALPVVRTILGFLSISGALVVSQVLYCFWQARHLNAPVFHPARTALPAKAAGAPARVIVILFDELSFQQTFASRAPGLHLPAFDALAAASTVFTDVRPAAEYTDNAIPSLWTGKRVTATQASPNGRAVELKDAAGWTKLESSDTFFGDAQHAGYRTSVAGWHIPYCRVLAKVLDRCAWQSRYTIAPWMDDDRSILLNTLQPFRVIVNAVPRFLQPHAPLPFDKPAFDRHLGDFEEIARAADNQLNDPSLTFVLLHMPVPHQNGIYDRQEKRSVPRQSSYLDNLALADAYLGHARSLLEANGSWDNSAVLVMGDHSWRTFLWRNSPYWVPEDEQASHGGVFDDRPALLVKCAGETTGRSLNAAFDATRTRTLLDAILQGRVRTPAELQRWAGP